MPVIAKGPIAKGLPNSNPYPNLTLENTRKPSIVGKPQDAAVNSTVATTAFSYGGLSPVFVVNSSPVS